ncbi:DNA excision repair protein ERCC-3 [Paenibacillus shirakamiensis]|uniref:DNA 3'-5' helicase n=1 Tax=Paenibacillus shirakamiensis TaxID=1265935 RepID=A0ABS4JED3_9BACL|nr:DNA repair helicase XPB [Paenibacillus shirakamiensis]MBP1999331.1 DNA excision repair protein ERCC-3 [Paenibacillus shirakamiensis]
MDQGSCIVQRDGTVLLEKNHKGFEEARSQLNAFAELIKSPEGFHTYRITSLSLWNAASAGWQPQEVTETLRRLSRFPIPDKVVNEVTLWLSRYGRLYLRENPYDPTTLELISDASEDLDQIEKITAMKKFALRRSNANTIKFHARYRGTIKQELTRQGYPVLDEAGYHQGSMLSFALKSGEPSKPDSSFQLRPYQRESVMAFLGEKSGLGGSGVLVLPCGAGKTIIGIAAMESLQCETLILTSNVTSVRQWIKELEHKTTLLNTDIGEYSGEYKQVCPVTVSTYQILTHRNSKEEAFTHMSLFNERDWGLIIYDEVHLLPAPVFRATADIQATRRLGLTATLIREDGCEKDVFSLIGPKRYEMPWRELEQAGWIASVDCYEVRVPMSSQLQERYVHASNREKFREASENDAKIPCVQSILELHAGEKTLIIGQYVNQLILLADILQVPLITGSTPQQERVRLYDAFRAGQEPVLIVSKVANFAVDLPDAKVGIQISGSFGSRQEEAQRLGRLLRPKSGENRAYFYTLVTEGTKEQEFALRRQLFLIEQGYHYYISRGLDELRDLDEVRVKEREVLKG